MGKKQTTPLSQWEETARKGWGERWRGSRGVAPQTPQDANKEYQQQIKRVGDLMGPDKVPTTWDK